MSKGLRLSEKWFNRGLWLVAFVFSWFLIGLGDTLIRDLPKVQKNYKLDSFIDKKVAAPLRQELKSLDTERRKIAEQIDQGQLKLITRRSDYNAERTTFNN